MQPLRHDELERLIQVDAGRRATRERNRALVHVLAGSGLGVAEGLAIRLEDVDCQQGTLRVTGRRARVVPMSGDASEALREWCARRRHDSPGEGLVFCTGTGDPLEASYVRRLLTRLGHDARVAGGLNARRLRETYAAGRIATGVSTQALGYELGHTTPASTRRYVRALAPTPGGEGVPGACGTAPDDPALVETLLENAHCGLVVLRAVRAAGTITDFVIEYINPSGAGVMGTSPELLAGCSVAERFPDAVTNGTFERWTSLIAEQGRMGESRMSDQVEGRPRWFAVRRVAHGDRLIMSFNDLGALREAEALRSQIQARSDAMATVLHDGLVVVDADGRIASVNPAAERILGVASERLIGRTAHDPRWHALNEDGSPCPAPMHPSVVTQRTGQAIEGKVLGSRRADGTTVWMRVSTQAIEGAGGPPFPVAVAFSELREAREAEGRARRAEAGTALMASLGGGLFLRCAPDGAILDAHGDAMALLGRPPEALRGRRPEEQLTPAERNRWQGSHLRALEADAIVETEYDTFRSEHPTRIACTLRAVRDPLSGDAEEVHCFLRPRPRQP